jgi:hypothetical protein
MAVIVTVNGAAVPFVKVYAGIVLVPDKDAKPPIPFGTEADHVMEAFGVEDVKFTALLTDPVQID